MSDPSDEFSVEMHSGADDVLVVTLDGELDLAKADWVEDTLAAAAPHHHQMVVDLAKVTFLDSTGIRTLVALRQRAQLLRLDIHFRQPSRAVQRTLRSAGLTGILDDPA